MSKRCQRNPRSKWHSTRRDQEPAPTEREARAGSSQPWRCEQEMGICRCGEAGEAFQELHLMIFKVFPDLRDSLLPFAQHHLWKFLVCSWTLSSDLHHSQSAARPGSTQLAPAPTHGWWVMFPLQHSPPSLPPSWVRVCWEPFGMDRQQILLRRGIWGNLLQGLMPLSWFSCCPCNPPPALCCAAVEATRAPGNSLEPCWEVPLGQTGPTGAHLSHHRGEQPQLTQGLHILL